MTTETSTPSAESGSWHDPTNAYNDDANYAYCGSGEGDFLHEFSGYGFATSGTINVVRVDIKGYSGDDGKHSINVYVWDGGAWQLVGTITAETECQGHQFDASAYIDTPAKVNGIKVQLESQGLSSGARGGRYVRVCWVPVYVDWTGGVQFFTRFASAGLDAVGTPDRAFIGTRALSGTVGLAGISVRGLVSTRGAAPSIGAVATAVRSLVGSRFASATASLSGTSGRVKGALRTAAASIGVTGLTVRGWIGKRVSSAAMSAVGLSSRILYGFRTVSASLEQIAVALGELYFAIFSGGLYHEDVGDGLTRVEWEADDSHGIDSGTSFPGDPSETDRFYRTDEHKWYFYNGTDWINMVA